MVLSTLILGVALVAQAQPEFALADFDEDDFRSSWDDADELEALLGAPRDQRHDGFVKQATCAGSPNRQHTMAQGVVNFQNGCKDVMAEIQARAEASAAGTWTDPHNKGKYNVEATEGNLLKVKRRTGNNKYTDQITFALTTAGTGCSVNACSVSQSNSNNDAGTNMCNMGNLVCSSGVKNNQNGIACKSVGAGLTYTVPYLECGRYRTDGRYREHQCQNFATTCLRQPSAALEAPVKELKYLFN